MPDTCVPGTDTADVSIPVDEAVAPALNDPVARAAASRIVSRLLEEGSNDFLFEIIRTMQSDAHKRGLTDEMLDDELAAYNAERREAPPPE